MRLLAGILAFFILISSTGVVINHHYCKDELKSSALFVKAKKCSSFQDMDTPCQKKCDFYKKLGIKPKKKCCSDHATYVKSDIEKVVPDYSSSTEIEFTSIHPDLSIEGPDANYPLDSPDLVSHYKPPLITCNHPSLIQVFLL